MIRNRDTMLFCFCGPSGSGKTTIYREVLKRGTQLMFSVSSTTRTIRPGEVDGREYHFISREEFDRRIGSGYFLEHAQYSGNSYGTGIDNLETARKNGKDLLLEIEVQGIQQMQERFRPQMVTIGILPPTFEVLKNRLDGRATDTAEQKSRRLHRATEEIEIMLADGFADYLILNDDLEQSIQSAVSIIEAERLRLARATGDYRQFLRDTFSPGA